MTAGPKLKWEPMKEFLGEYECIVGNIEFSVSENGNWDVSVKYSKRVSSYALTTIDGGQCRTLSTAKRKCQQWLDRQWKAMCKLQEEQQ